MSPGINKLIFGNAYNQCLLNNSNVGPCLVSDSSGLHLNSSIAYFTKDANNSDTPITPITISGKTYSMTRHMQTSANGQSLTNGCLYLSKDGQFRNSGNVLTDRICGDVINAYFNATDPTFNSLVTDSGFWSDNGTTCTNNLIGPHICSNIIANEQPSGVLNYTYTGNPTSIDVLSGNTPYPNIDKNLLFTFTDVTNTNDYTPSNLTNIKKLICGTSSKDAVCSMCLKNTIAASKQGTPTGIQQCVKLTM